MILGTSISGFGHCHLCMYFTRGIHGNLQITRAFSFSFVLSSLESPKHLASVEPVLHSLHCSQYLPLNLLQHPCALLRVQTQDCRESSGHGCYQGFLWNPHFQCLPYNAPCFLGFLTAAALEVTRKLSTQIVGWDLCIAKAGSQRSIK